MTWLGLHPAYEGMEDTARVYVRTEEIVAIWTAATPELGTAVWLRNKEILRVKEDAQLILATLLEKEEK